MSIASSLYSWLMTNAAITALVGTRVYPSVIPAHVTARPVLTYAQEAGSFIEHMAGRSNTRMSEFSLDCWSDRYSEARELADTVTIELVGTRGTFGADTAESIRLENDFDVPPEPETDLYRVSLRFEIAYN